MTIINFDPAGGIIKKEVVQKPIQIKKRECVKKIKKILSKLFKLDIDQIILGNNETSILRHILNCLGIKNPVLIATNHEYISIVRMAEGKDVSKYVTRPSSNLRAGIPTPEKTFVQSKIIINYKDIDQFKKDIAKKIKNKNRAILLLISHVSRITGEIFRIKEIFDYVERLNQYRKSDEKIYLIVDGAQSVFTFPIEPKKYSHIYLGTSSKALGAEPAIGFAFLNIKLRISDYFLSSKRALISFFQLLENFSRNTKKIHASSRETKNKIIKLFQCLGFKMNTGKAFSPYILAINHPRAERIKNYLKEKNIIIANSADPTYTISRFTPKIRISWRNNINQVDIDNLGSIFAKVFFIDKLCSRKILSNIFGKSGILFVDAGKPGGSVYGYSKPLSVNILQTIAKENNINSSFVCIDDIPGKNNQEKTKNLQKKLKNFGILAVTSTSPGHARIIDILKNLKEFSMSDNFIVLKGGIHEREAAIILQKDITYPVDLSFLDESDESFAKFLKILKRNYVLKNRSLYSIEKELKKIDGIHYKNNENDPKKIFLEPRNFILPLFEFVEIEKPYALLDHTKGKSMTRLMTMRGCAFGCIFCAIVKNCRRLNPQKTVNYIKYLKRESDKRKTPIERLFFEDATFTIEEKLKLPKIGRWSRKFAELLKKENIKIPFGIQTRIDCLNREIIEILADVGLESVYLGVESLSDKQLASFNKGFLVENKLQELFNLVNVLKKHGVGISVSLIWIPKSDNLLMNTIRFLMQLGIDEIFVEAYKIYPGAGLALSYGKDKIAEIYNKGVNRVYSPNPEDLNSVIIDSSGKYHVEFNLYKIYKKITELIKNSNYQEVNPGHYYKKEKIQFKDPSSFFKRHLTTNPK